MKLGTRDVCYRPYTITTVKAIENGDINANGAVILPEEADEVGEKAVSSGIKIKTVVIPNINVQICSHRLRKMKAKFILSKGEELNSLFSGILSPEIILPKTLQSIKKTGFKNSTIEKVEIPDSVTECDEDIFNYSKIRRLIINERLLSQISAKFLLFIKDNISLTVKTDEKQTKNYIFSKIDMNFISSINYIDEAIELFLNNINAKRLSRDIRNKFRKKLKRKILVIMKLKLLFKKDSEVLINNLVVNDSYLSRILKEDNLRLFPNISCDGLSIKVNEKKVKALTLKDYIEKI